jgi:hypothetical protein
MKTRILQIAKTDRPFDIQGIRSIWQQVLCKQIKENKIQNFLSSSFKNTDGHTLVSYLSLETAIIEEMVTLKALVDLGPRRVVLWLFLPLLLFFSLPLHFSNFLSFSLNLFHSLTHSLSLSLSHLVF